MRTVAGIQGRLMAGLYVGPWENPEDPTGEYFGLYGDLRIDSADAQAKVDDGTYSQVSLSFDDEFGGNFRVFVRCRGGSAQISGLKTKEKERWIFRSGLILCR